MGGYRVKKRLGQHFLKSQAIIDQLVAIIDPKAGENLIEIGPGRGALTKAMAPSGAQITAVEFDADLISSLSHATSGCDNVRIVNEDFLHYEPTAERFKLVGNIPYNITSPVVDWLVAHHGQVDRAFLMVQKELAQRLTSSPGSKDWSPIAIFTQLHFDIRHCFDVPARHFNPPPRVVSSVIEFEPKESIQVPHFDRFEKLVRASFRHRRKTLINNLVPELTPDRELAFRLLADMNMPERVRAEQVTIAQFLELTDLLVSHNMI